MSKKPIEKLAKKIASKKSGSIPFHQEKEHYQTSEPKYEDSQSKAIDDKSSITLRAYQIHLEKGGSDLDNWLEAEQLLTNKN